MSDLDAQGVKIYGEGRLKFSVNDKDMVTELPEARK